MRIAVRSERPVDLLKSMEIVKARGILLRKSGGIMHMGDGTDPGVMHSWDNEQVLNPDAGGLNPWYDEGPSNRDKPWVKSHPNARAHHPLWSINPRDGTLEMREDKPGTPQGFHPIDYVNHELYGLLKKYGITGITPQKINQMAIDMYNKEHVDARGDSSPHRLPDEDDIRWRQIHVIPYQMEHQFDATNRQTHSQTKTDYGWPAFGTYFDARGDQAHPLAAKGPRADSGALHHHEQLGGALKAINEVWKSRGQPHIPEGVIDKLNIVRRSNISPKNLTMHRSAPINQNQLKSWEARGGRGAPAGPADAKEQAYGSGMPHDVVEHLPDEFFGVKMRDDGTAISGSAAKRRREWLADMGERHGFDEHDQALLNEMGATQFIHPNGQADTPRTRAGTLVNRMLNAHGVDPSDREFIHHRGEYESMRHTAEGARQSSANAAGMAVALGYMRGPEAMRNTHTPYGDATYDESHRELANRLVEASRADLQEAGHETPPLTFGKPSEYQEKFHDASVGARMPAGLGHEHQLSPLWENHFHHDHEMAPVGGQAAAPAPAPAPAPPSRAPAPTATQQGAAPPPGAPPGSRMATSGERAYMSSLGQMTPAQIHAVSRTDPQFSAIPPQGALAAQQAALDPGQSAFNFKEPGAPLIFRSEQDLRTAIGDVQKALEDMQMQNVLDDGNVMKHVPRSPIPLDSSIEVGMFAKSLGLTGHDVRAICASKGDWSQIADKWQVPEKTVSIVKASFRRCVV
jgi:hypothetical protein